MAASASLPYSTSPTMPPLSPGIFCRTAVNSISRNPRNRSNHRGPVVGHRLNSTATNKTVEKAKMDKEKTQVPVQCVGKDTVPSGSVVNTTESRSSDSSRVTPSTEVVKKTTTCNGSPAQRAASFHRKRNKKNGKTSFHNGPSENQSSVRSNKTKYNDSNNDSKHEKRHRTIVVGDRVPGISGLSSSVVDSGRGDELSSSCESDPQPQTVECRSVSVKLPGPQSPLPCSSSHSDVEEDFQDALSNLPSENEQSKSSTSSSAFVTPLSTRSQSPVLSKASSEVCLHPDHHELAKALMDSLSSMAESQENTDSSGISSDISKDTVVDASSARDSSSYEEKSSHGETDKMEPSCASSTSKSSSKASGSGGHSKREKKLNSMQRKTRRMEQSKVDSGTHKDGLCKKAESDDQKSKNTGKHDFRAPPRNNSPLSSLDSPVTRRPHVKHKSKRQSSDHQDRASQHQAKKLQPLFLHVPPQEQKLPTAAQLSHLPPPKGQKPTQLGVEFSSLSSASPASSVCSYSPVTLSPSPTASLHMHQPVPLIGESSAVGLPVQRQLVLGSTANLNADSGSQEPVCSNGDDDDAKDEWPDFGMFASNSNNCSSGGVTSVVTSKQQDFNKLVEIAKQDSRPCDPPSNAASSLPEVLFHTREAPSSAFKVLSSAPKPLPSTSEVPSSAFKVLSTPEVLFPSFEVPSSAFKVSSSAPEATLTFAPEATLTAAPEAVLTSVPERLSSSSEPRADEATEEEEVDSRCSMSTGSGGDSATSGTSSKNQLPETTVTTEHVQYALTVDGAANPLCDPLLQQQHLSPNQYLQLKRDQLNKFVQQYQEKLEKQTDNQIFFPVEPPPPPHMTLPSVPMLSSPPAVPMLSPTSIQMMTTPMFLQSPPPPLHHLHPSGPDIRTSLAGAPPFLSTSPPPPPPPPLPPNLPYNVMLPPPLPSTAGQDLLASSVDGQCISTSAAEFHPSEEDPVEGAVPTMDEVEHPLSDTWVMWFDRVRSHSSDYQDGLNEVSSISSIEQFWQVYNHIVSPHAMEVNSNLHYFKQGIQPLWEDPANQDGGKWVLTIRNDQDRLAKCWMEVLLLLVGGGVEKGHLINGAVTSRRKKGDRIALWTSTRDEEANLDICIDLVRAVMLGYDVPLEKMEVFMKDLSEGRHGMSLVFMYHSDALASGHSYLNNAHIRMADHIEVILRELRRVHNTNPSEKVD